MNDLVLISRKEAISTGLKWYFTGKPCKNNHISKRYTKSGCCCDCNLHNSLMWQKRNPSLAVERNKNWRLNNPEKYKESNKKWRVNNPSVVRKLSADKRARKRFATPSWLSKDQKLEILATYRLAAELEITTGVKHNVDHIIPLSGENVSGLHVPWNLRVISAYENRRKHNKINE
jgi:hypothetical protein